MKSFRLARQLPLFAITIAMLGCSVDTNDNGSDADEAVSALDSSSSSHHSGYRVQTFGNDGVLAITAPVALSSTPPASVISDGAGGSFAVVTEPNPVNPNEPPLQSVEHHFADGTIDKKFGGVGKATMPWFTLSYPDHVLFRLLPDVGGGFLVLNASMMEGSSQIARFGSDGTLDTSFGSGGYLEKRFGNYGHYADGLVTVLSLAQGGYLVFGRQTRGRSPTCDFVTYFARLDRAGRLVNTWDKDGFTVQRFVKNSEITSARIVGDKVELALQAIGWTARCEGSHAGPGNKNYLAQIWL